MNEVADISFWSYFLSMTGYVVFLLLLVEGMRRYPKVAFVVWLLSLLTFPLWFDNLEGWFRWAKTFSVLIPTALVVGFARMAYLYKNNKHPVFEFYRHDWVLWCLYGVLFLNIAEATLKDAATGNYFNFICGVILCITIPFPKYKNGLRQYWLIDKNKPNELLFYSTASWNFLYTTWNMCFVYGESPAYFASSFCILLAAELYPILKKRPELYVLARVYTLAFHIMMRSCYDIFTPVMDSTSWASDTTLYWWGAANLALHIPFAIWFFMRKRANERKEPPTGDNLPPTIKSQVIA